MAILKIARMGHPVLLARAAEGRPVPEPVTFVHVDCDIYSAAKCALSHVRPMLADGAIIAFDELLNYPGFEKHEMRALYEVTEEEGLRYEWLIAGGGTDSWLSERAAILVHSGHASTKG